MAAQVAATAWPGRGRADGQAKHGSRAAAPFAAAFHRERQLECDPFDAAARQELEDGLMRLGEGPAVRALR